MLYIAWSFWTEWRQGTKDAESHPAVSCRQVTDHIKPIVCVWSITLTDADIISYPGSHCLVALAIAGHCSLPTHFHRVKSNVTSLLRCVKSAQRWPSETCLMHHCVLCLPKPLIGRWCNRTYPNPDKLILMTIWAVTYSLCLLVWSLARDDGEETELWSRPKVKEGSSGCPQPQLIHVFKKQVICSNTTLIL